MADRRDDPVRPDAGGLDLVGPELPGAHEYGAHADRLRACDVALEVVPDHPGPFGVGVERVAGSVEVRRARLAEDDRLDVGGVLEAGDEGSGVEQRPALR